MARSVVSDDQIQVLSVFLNDQVFGIAVADIQDVLRGLMLTRVPLAAAHIAGVCNLRGHIVTAINLNNRIFNKDSDVSASMNVVIEHKGELYSMLVDRVGNVITLDKSEIEEPPLTMNGALKDSAKGVYQLDESIMVLLDAEKVIAQTLPEKGREHEIVSYSG